MYFSARFLGWCAVPFNVTCLLGRNLFNIYEPQDCVVLNEIKEIKGERGICFCKKGCMCEGKSRRET